MNIIDRERIANLGRNHYSDSEIAKRIGITPNEVAAVRAELGAFSEYVEIPRQKSIDQISAILTDALLPSKIISALSVFVDNSTVNRKLATRPAAIIPPVRRMQVKSDPTAVPLPQVVGDRPASLRAVDAMAIDGISVAEASKRFKVSTPAIYAMLKKLRATGKLDKRIKLQPRSAKAKAKGKGNGKASAKKPPKAAKAKAVAKTKKEAKRYNEEVMRKATAIAKAQLKAEAEAEAKTKKAVSNWEKGPSKKAPTKKPIKAKGKPVKAPKAPVKVKAPTKPNKTTKPTADKKAQPKPATPPASWETHI